MPWKAISPILSIIVLSGLVAVSILVVYFFYEDYVGRYTPKTLMLELISKPRIEIVGIDSTNYYTIILVSVKNTGTEDIEIINGILGLIISAGGRSKMKECLMSTRSILLEPGEIRDLSFTCVFDRVYDLDKVFNTTSPSISLLKKSIEIISIKTNTSQGEAELWG